jgi:hypothetical protein
MFLMLPQAIAPARRVARREPLASQSSLRFFLARTGAKQSLRLRIDSRGNL